MFKKCLKSPTLPLSVQFKLKNLMMHHVHANEMPDVNQRASDFLFANLLTRIAPLSDDFVLFPPAQSIKPGAGEESLQLLFGSRVVTQWHIA